MIQDFQNTRADYQALYAYLFRKRLRWRIPLRLLIAFLLAMNVGFSFQHRPFGEIGSTGIALFTAFIFLLFSFIFGLIGYFIGYGIFINRSTNFERKRVTLSPDGLYFEADNRSELFHWENLRSLEVHKGSVYLAVARRKYMVIGAQNFVSQEHLDYFLAEIGKYRRF